MSSAPQKLTRIGVFYDGNFFRLVSNYYAYSHPRQARISISGLHDFIRHRVADEEGAQPRLCRVVEAHYFRGRLRAHEADERNMLLAERSFDDVLMREGVTTHYLPIGPHGEKGVDVLLALEAFERAMYKRFDVLVLLACDSDFVPLVRKLHALGTRVMLLGWDFVVAEPGREERETRTAQALIDAVTFPVLMHQVIADPANADALLVNGLFLRSEPREQPAAGEGACGGVVQNLREGYGFITPHEGGANIYFAWSALVGVHPHDLHPGMAVDYELSQNAKGPCALNVRLAAGALQDPATISLLEQTQARSSAG